MQSGQGMLSGAHREEPQSAIIARAAGAALGGQLSALAAGRSHSLDAGYGTGTFGRQSPLQAPSGRSNSLEAGFAGFNHGGFPTAAAAAGVAPAAGPSDGFSPHSAGAGGVSGFGSFSRGGGFSATAAAGPGAAAAGLGTAPGDRFSPNSPGAGGGSAGFGRFPGIGQMGAQGVDLSGGYLGGVLGPGPGVGPGLGSGTGQGVGVGAGLMSSLSAPLTSWPSLSQPMGSLQGGDGGGSQLAGGHPDSWKDMMAEVGGYGGGSRGENLPPMSTSPRPGPF